MWYFTCEIQHVKFHMWFFTCDFTWEDSHAIFHMWNLTCETQSHVKFHMWQFKCDLSHVKHIMISHVEIFTCETHGVWNSRVILEPFICETHGSYIRYFCKGTRFHSEWSGDIKLWDESKSLTSFKRDLETFLFNLWLTAIFSIFHSCQSFKLSACRTVCAQNVNVIINTILYYVVNVR